MIKDGNRDLSTLNKLADENSTNLSAWKAGCAKIAADEDALARKLNAGAWPENAKSAVAALVSSTIKDRVSFQDCADAGSLDDVTSVLSARGQGFAAEAEAVRVALGLPGNTTATS
jgi:hypothetical protein